MHLEGPDVSKDIEGIARGEDPKAVVRDAEINRCIGLPIADRKNLVEGMTLEQIAKHPLAGGQLRDYVFKLASRLDVRQAYAEAMGLPK